MRFVFMFKTDALGTSRVRHPPDITLKPFFVRHLWGSFSKTLKLLNSSNSLVFQVHI